MSDNRLQQIRAAVARDTANLEDAYADRAWLLTQHDNLRGVLSLVNLALSQHTSGPAVAAMCIAANGPSIGEVVSRALEGTK